VADFDDYYMLPGAREVGVDDHGRMTAQCDFTLSRDCSPACPPTLRHVPRRCGPTSSEESANDHTKALKIATAMTAKNTSTFEIGTMNSND